MSCSTFRMAAAQALHSLSLVWFRYAFFNRGNSCVEKITKAALSCISSCSCQVVISAKLTSLLRACEPLLKLHNAKPTQQRSQRHSDRHNGQDTRHSDRGNKGAFRIMGNAFASRKAPHLVFTGPWRSFGWHFAIFSWIHLLESGILDRGLSLSGFHDFFLKTGGVPIVHMIFLAPGQALTASSSTAHAVTSQASRRDPCSAISAGTRSSDRAV